MIENDLPRMTVRMQTAEAQRLQKAWTRSGDFSNRTQFVKAAINAYAGEKIFELKECKA